MAKPYALFYHQDREVIASCKSCGKGLCPACAVDLVRGLACRGLDVLGNVYIAVVSRNAVVRINAVDGSPF